MASCKCTKTETCNPCTNTVRFEDICAACIVYGHLAQQSKDYVKTNTSYDKK